MRKEVLLIFHKPKVMKQTLTIEFNKDNETEGVIKVVEEMQAGWELIDSGYKNDNKTFTWTLIKA